VLQGLRPLNPVDCRDIHIADGRTRSGWFSGNVLKVARDEIPVRWLTPETAFRTLRMALPVDLRKGRWPLISAGSPGGGELLFLDVGAKETARFGYFSTGAALCYGPPFRLVPGSPLECTVRMEPLDASGGFPGPPRPLWIEINGRINWMSYVPYHPSAPGEIRIGANTVSAPLTEESFPGEIQWGATPARLRPAEPTDHLLLRVTFPAQAQWGLREPLLLTGIPGAYDGIEVVHYGGGLGRFVLDHYGRLNQEGPIFSSFGGESIHDIEIITPVFSLYKGSRNPTRGTIVVRMDGKEMLRLDSDLFPAQLGEVSVGKNDFGGPSEKTFLGALLLERWIGAPDR
jgi:hypothetical protein